MRAGFWTVELNDAGPVQAYVAPVTAGVDKLIVPPVQTGELAVAVGVAGTAFTTTAVVAAALVHPPTVTVTLYVPAIAVVAEGRDGFCTAEVKVEGPVHAYVAPATVVEVRLMAEPAQTGELLPAVGAAGVGFTTTVAVPAALVHPLTVIVTL